MTGNLPSVMYLMRSTNILQSNINLAFSCSNKMLRSFDETPSRAISCSLGIQTTIKLGQGQLGSTDLSVENCLQQMHFITQLQLFSGIGTTHKLVRRTCSFSFFLSSLLSLSAHGFSGSPCRGFLPAPLSPEVVGTLLEPTLS